MTHNAERPWCCPEPRCVIVSQGDDSGEPWSVPQPGKSFTCFGRSPREVTFFYDGVDHANDLNVCLYSATKGVLRFQMNISDLWLIAGDFLQALKAVAPTEYEAWGKPERPARLPVLVANNGSPVERSRPREGRSESAGAVPEQGEKL